MTRTQFEVWTPRVCDVAKSVHDSEQIALDHARIWSREVRYVELWQTNVVDGFHVVDTWVRATWIDGRMTA